MAGSRRRGAAGCLTPGLAWIRHGVALNSPKARGGCDGEEEAGVCTGEGGASQRGRGLGGHRIRGGQRLESSRHTEDRRDFDHITIHSPDCLSLPPPALVTKMRAHAPACVSSHVPPRSQDPEKGTGTSSSTALQPTASPGLPSLHSLVKWVFTTQPCTTGTGCPG